MNTPGISREFSTGELLRFAAPSIVMMLFLSMYTIVDGFFISRYVGTAALSATNIVYPLIGFFLAVDQELCARPRDTADVMPPLQLEQERFVRHAGL